MSLFTIKTVLIVMLISILPMVEQSCEAYSSNLSFYSTSSYISSRPNYSVEVSSPTACTHFSTSASAITGGITLANSYDDNVENNRGPLKSSWAPPTNAPIGDIPWIVIIGFVLAFALIKNRNRT